MQLLQYLLCDIAECEIDEGKIQKEDEKKKKTVERLRLRAPVDGKVADDGGGDTEETRTRPDTSCCHSSGHSCKKKVQGATHAVSSDKHK